MRPDGLMELDITDIATRYLGWREGIWLDLAAIVGCSSYHVSKCRAEGSMG